MAALNLDQEDCPTGILLNRYRFPASLSYALRTGVPAASVGPVQGAVSVTVLPLIPPAAHIPLLLYVVFPINLV